MVLLKTSKKILIEKEDGRHKSLKDDQSMLFGARCGERSTLQIQISVIRTALYPIHLGAEQPRVVQACGLSHRKSENRVILVT